MSSNEETDRAKREPEAEDVVAHMYVADEAGEDDLAGKKRKKKQSEEPEGDDFGRRKK